MLTYTWYQWILFFFIYCFFGWIIESTYVSLQKHHFVNRGFLRLPMIPLYGSGAVMMLWVSIPVRDSLPLVYLSGVIAATALEYVTGWCMERLFQMKYWDYSNQKFQLHGYICLGTSLSWGLLTIFLTEIIHEPIEHLVLSIPTWAAIILVIVVGSMFIADTIQSVKAALDLGKTLETITRIRQEVEEIQTRLRYLRTAAELRKAELQEEISLRLESDFPELTERLAALSERRRAISEKLGRHRAGLIRRNPTASSARFNEALKELKEYLEELRK